MKHDEVIKAIDNSVRSHPQIQALFLSGSHGNGLADEYSDIDFIMITEDGASDEAVEIWREAVSQAGEIVLWWHRTVLINAVTADWTRIDVLILKPDQMKTQSQSDLKPLFDRDGIYGNLPKVPENQGPNRARLKYQIEEFIRILGLLHVGMGREEYINGVLGIFHLRNLLVDLLIEETAAPNRGGVLHLNRLITDEQKELLLSLPPATPNREALISANLAYAEAYLPRARKLAREWNVEWPERFEAATWDKLEDSLNITRPDNTD